MSKINNITLALLNYRLYKSPYQKNLIEVLKEKVLPHMIKIIQELTTIALHNNLTLDEINKQLKISLTNRNINFQETFNTIINKPFQRKKDRNEKNISYSQ